MDKFVCLVFYNQKSLQGVYSRKTTREYIEQGINVNIMAQTHFTQNSSVLADSLGAALMGLEPQEIGYLKYCADERIGSLDLSKVKGENPEKISVEFRMHKDYEIHKKWKSLGKTKDNKRKVEKNTAQ